MGLIKLIDFKKQHPFFYCFFLAITDRIEDKDLLNISEKIPVGELENFAVKGLGFTFIQFENLTDGFARTKKTLEILKKWHTSAPISESASAMPHCSYGGLKLALRRANLNGVIRDLGLDKYP